MNNLKRFAELNAYTPDQSILDKLVFLSQNNTKIIINIVEFCDLLKSEGSEKLFEPITDRETLRAGFYGTVNNMKIFCMMIVGPGEYCHYYDTNELKEPTDNQANINAFHRVKRSIESFNDME